MALNFGLITLAQSAEDDQRTSKQLYDDVMEDVVLAESLGYDTYWFGEHHFSNYGSIPSPNLLMAALSQRTSRIRFGHAVILAPFYHPVRIVEEATMLDILSDGRLDLGLGRGYQPSEMAGFQIDPATTREWLEETITLAKNIWETGHADFESQLHNIHLPEFVLGPVQRPHPPIWLACISAESFVRAGELGLHVLANPSISPMAMVKENIERYRDSLEKNGYDPAKFSVGIAQEIYIADTKDEAEETVRPYTLSFHRRVAGKVAPPPGEAPMKSFELYAKSRERMERVTFDDLIETHAAIFADPAEAVERLRFYESELGITHHIAWMDLGGIPVDKMRKSLRKFAEQVIPAFKEIAAAG